MIMGRRFQRPWARAACAAYLLGTAVALLHSLEESAPLGDAVGRPMGPGRALSLRCSGPSCPDPHHHHHHPDHHRPAHDPSSCASCQLHSSACAAMPSGESPPPLAPPGKVMVASAVPPALADRSSPRTRSPPSA